MNLIKFRQDKAELEYHFHKYLEAFKIKYDLKHASTTISVNELDVTDSRSKQKELAISYIEIDFTIKL